MFFREGIEKNGSRRFYLMDNQPSSVTEDSEGVVPSYAWTAMLPQIAFLGIHMFKVCLYMFNMYKYTFSSVPYFCHGPQLTLRVLLHIDVLR